MSEFENRSITHDVSTRASLNEPHFANEAITPITYFEAHVDDGGLTCCVLLNDNERLLY